MVLATYGPGIDLHAGGADLRFPHHAVEAVLGEAATGVAPFARAWLHPGTVRVAGAKMAKSTGNLVLVEDLLATHDPGAVRLLCLHRDVAQAWDFEPAGLDAAQALLADLYAAAGRPGRRERPSPEVDAALRDDLDVRPGRRRRAGRRRSGGPPPHRGDGPGRGAHPELSAAPRRAAPRPA